MKPVARGTSSHESAETDMSRGTESLRIDSELDSPRPQLSFKSNDEEILKEVCLNNGINFKKLPIEGPQTKVLEMFFSGYPRLTGMHYFPNLTTLTVIGQSVSCLEGLSGAYYLEELWVAECQLTKIEGLGKCKSLSKLFLYGNKISVIENVLHLFNLKVLWLNNNLIKNIENLYTLTKMKELNLAENLIETIGNSLTHNSQLEDLNLSGNPLCSLRDLTCLVKLQKLVRLSLKDPLYHPSPVGQLCNYSTHIMYHLPNLTSLDTIDITSRQLADLAEGTVNKKKMFYNMRAKTIQRNLSSVLAHLDTAKRNMLELPYSKLKYILFVIKEMERQLETAHAADLNDSDPESEREMRRPGDQRFAYRMKLEALNQRKAHWEEKCNNIESYAAMCESRMRQMVDVLINRLLVELETGGNVRFEDGQFKDPWYTSCHDLVLSRFCVYDYRDLGVIGIKIHRIIRIHNRMLRTRFDKSIFAMTDSNNGEYYPGNNKNTAYKKSLEYLFWMSDPDVVGGGSEGFCIPEEGFMDAETYMKLGREGAVPLSNSISLADRRRIAHCIKMSRDDELEKCPFRYGQLIVAKTHLGKSVVAKNDKFISKPNYPKMDSVFKPRKNCLPREKLSLEGDCECSARQCEWYVFNNHLVLPEYIIHFEYVTRVKSQCPFQNLNEDLLSEQPALCSQVPALLPIKSDSDDDILKMEPEIVPRARMINLTEEFLLKSCRADSFQKITCLNLHGSGLSSLYHVQRLVSLKRLVVSFNEFVQLDELSNMHLQYLDASFNKIISLEGLKGMYYLEELNLSWNKLCNTREELSYLRKHMSNLSVLDLRNNPLIKAKDLRLRAIGRLRNLQVLNAKNVEEEEVALAMRCAAGSRISQLSLLTYSRTDSIVPRSLALGDSAHIITMISRNKPLKKSEEDLSWCSTITTLNLDGQRLTKLSNLDRLVNLKYASFKNNDLTRIEGLDKCTLLLELSLAHNCLSVLEGLHHLVRLQHLDLSHNFLATIETGLPDTLTALTCLSLESNHLTSLNGLQRGTALVELYIGNNRISNIRDVFLLKLLPSLVILDMYGNPMVTEVENYRIFVIYHLRSLKALDGSAISPKEIRREVAQYHKTQAYLDLLLLDMNNSFLLQENTEFNNAKEMFDGRLTVDFIAEKLGHSKFGSVSELDLQNSGIKLVNLGTGQPFSNLRSVNLEHNNLQSLSGLTNLTNLKVLCLNNNHVESILPKTKLPHGNHCKARAVAASGGKNFESLENSAPVLINLEVLHLGYNGIKDMAALQLNRLPSLKSLFLQGNEITKVEGLEELPGLKELVLDRNRIKQLSDRSFVGQRNLQELHLEENRLRDLSGFGCLENLCRLYLGNNRLQDYSELARLDKMQHLTDISLVNNAITQRSMHRILLIHILPNLKVIDSIPVTEEERGIASAYMTEQLLVQQQSASYMDTTLPGINRVKPNVLMKVTNVQLMSALGGNSSVNSYEEESSSSQKVRAKLPGHDLVRHTSNIAGGSNAGGCTAQTGNSRRQYPYNSHMTYPHSADAETINRLNQPRTSKR